jgi:hypothetical protein
VPCGAHRLASSAANELCRSRAKTGEKIKGQMYIGHFFLISSMIFTRVFLRGSAEEKEGMLINNRLLYSPPTPS